jgi:hypothetical protein
MVENKTKRDEKGKFNQSNPDSTIGGKAKPKASIKIRLYRATTNTWEDIN